jgi:hypothetical protein
LEYQELIVKANQIEDRGLQCLYILSAFIIILGNTLKTVQKPFNPVIGETFEYFDPQFKTRYIAEQISHHPPITAFHAENESFIYQGWIQVKVEVGLSGIFILTLGDTFVTLKSTNETFKFQRGSSSVHNLVFG